MLINLSNHPSNKWSEEQKSTALKQFGNIVDLPFPAVDADANESYIAALAAECVQKVFEIGDKNTFTVHVMGEMTLTFAIVKRLQNNNVKCVASTTQRDVVEDADGTKLTLFRFIKFREYLTQ